MTADKQLSHPALGTSGLQRRLAVGAIWSGLAQVASTLAAFAVTVILVRMMPTSEYGIFSTALAASSLASILSGLGLAQAIPQVAAAEHAVRGDAGLFDALLAGLRIATWLAFATVTIAAVLSGVDRLYPKTSTLVQPLITLVPLVALIPIGAVLGGFLHAAYRPRALAVSMLINSAAILLAAMLVLRADRDSAMAMAGGRSVAAAAGVVFLGLYVRRMLVRSRTLDRASCQRSRLLRRVLTFGISGMLGGVFITAVSQFDVLALGLIRGSAAAAKYQPVSRLLDLLLQLPAFLAVFFLPLASAAAARSEGKNVRDLYHWASRWLLASSAAPLALLLVRPDALLHLLYGSSFSGGTAIARILGAGAIVHIALGLNGQAVTAFGEARAVMVIFLAALVVEVTACLILIPAFGITGAAWATSIALVTANLLCNGLLFRRFGIPPFSTAGLLTVLSFGVSTAVAALATIPASGDVLRCILVVAIAGGGSLCGSLLGGGSAERRAILGEIRARLGFPNEHPRFPSV